MRSLAAVWFVLLLLTTVSLASAQPEGFSPTAVLDTSTGNTGQINLTAGGDDQGLVTVPVDGRSSLPGSIMAPPAGSSSNTTSLDVTASADPAAANPGTSDMASGFPAPPLVSPPDGPSAGGSESGASQHIISNMHMYTSPAFCLHLPDLMQYNAETVLSLLYHNSRHALDMPCCSRFNCGPAVLVPCRLILCCPCLPLFAGVLLRKPVCARRDARCHPYVFSFHHTGLTLSHDSHWLLPGSILAALRG